MLDALPSNPYLHSLHPPSSDRGPWNGISVWIGRVRVITLYLPEIAGGTDQPTPER
jgi:hypothetical protein